MSDGLQGAGRWDFPCMRSRLMSASSRQNQSLGSDNYTANGSNCLVVVSGLGLVLLAAPGAAMHGRKTNRSPDWSGPPSLVGSSVCAVRPDRIVRKGGVTPCAVCVSAQGKTLCLELRVLVVRWTASQGS
jgi:hypothetical protein